ncbi:glycosyl hydrolase 53 family protein [Gynuella sp.]|uniref:glycosyl hydrolase 53 family protein n=1 Tax=Gynuella sp. TaxID=2969146 RepID=UPI003D0ACBD9
MSSHIRWLYLKIMVLIGLLAGLSLNSAWAAPVFAYGADIGWMKQLENEGVSWVNDNNVQQDPLQILKDHGINAVRLRVFVNPDPSAYWHKDGSTWTMLGYADKASVIAAAQRATNMGMRVMVDFHYSDVFADPGHQIKPAAWQNYSVSQLETAVYNHTYDVMNGLKNAGITPEWVQVGNEMDPGILLPQGSTSNFANLTRFLNAGYDAVKAVSASSKVVSHLAHGTNNAAARWYFNNFLNVYGGKTDVIGFSFYPYWDGESYWEITDDLAYNLNNMAATYGKEVMVTEVGGLQTNPTDSYWTVKDTIDLVKAVPNGKGIGVFYWEPEANSSVLPDGYPLGATTLVSNKVLKFTKALDAFSDGQIKVDSTKTYRIVNRNSGKALNVAAGSSADGAVIEQYGYGGWASQQWQFTAIGNGFYKIKNINSNKVMDIEAASTENGAQNIQWSDNGGWNQQWLILDVGNGYVKIKNRNSGKLLDIKAKSTADGALDIQWSDNGGWNQQWQILQN